MTIPPLEPPSEAQLRTIRNECLKWFAAALERAGTSAFTAGWFTPLIAYALDIGGLATYVKPASLGGVMLLSLAVAILFWGLAHKVLGDMRS